MWARAPLQLPAALAFVLSVFAAGCNDPNYKSAREVRDENLREFVRWYAEYDAQGPQRMEWLLELIKDSEAKRPRQLVESLRFVGEAHQRDLEQWELSAQERQEWFKELLLGRPEKLEEGWATMVRVGS